MIKRMACNCPIIEYTTQDSCDGFLILKPNYLGINETKEEFKENNDREVIYLGIMPDNDESREECIALSISQVEDLIMSLKSMRDYITS